MRTSFFIIIVLFLSTVCHSELVIPSKDNNLLVIGYLMTGNTPGINDQMAQQLTDIIYFSVEPANDGMLDTRRIKQSHIEHLSALREKHGVKIHLAVGGWGRCKHFPKVSLDDSLREKFVSELKKLCLKYKFDGIDFDWEFPKGEKEEQAYNQLIVQAAQSIHPEGKIVSCALSLWQKLSCEAYSALDRVHIMAYDQGKRHSTYEQSIESIVKFIVQGVDRDKLCLGVPFYGRKMSDTNQYLPYNEIVQKYHPKPDEDEAGGFYFNGPVTIQKKISYCIEQKISGVMIWEISHDTAGDSSLLKAISALNRE